MGHARKIVLALGIAALVFSASQAAFCQEADTAQQPGAQDETQWIWGEVVTVDGDKGEISVTYLDYDTDEEKQIIICVDENTKYENVKSLAEINHQDAVSIDYLALADKNIAQNISVDKTDEIEPPETVASEELPQGAPVVISEDLMVEDQKTE